MIAQIQTNTGDSYLTNLSFEAMFDLLNEANTADAKFVAFRTFFGVNTIIPINDIVNIIEVQP